MTKGSAKGNSEKVCQGLAHIECRRADRACRTTRGAVIASYSANEPASRAFAPDSIAPGGLSAKLGSDRPHQDHKHESKNADCGGKSRGRMKQGGSREPG